MCVDTFGFATLHCADCIVMPAWMLQETCFGKDAGARNIVFLWKVAGAGPEGKLLCEAGAGWLRPSE